MRVIPEYLTSSSDFNLNLTKKVGGVLSSLKPSDLKDGHNLTLKISVSGEPVTLNLSIFNENDKLYINVNYGLTSRIDRTFELYEYRNSPSLVFALTLIRSLFYTLFYKTKDGFNFPNENGYSSYIFRVLEENGFYEDIDDFIEDYDLDAE